MALHIRKSLNHPLKSNRNHTAIKISSGCCKLLHSFTQAPRRLIAALCQHLPPLLLFCTNHLPLLVIATFTWIRSPLEQPQSEIHYVLPECFDCMTPTPPATSFWPPPLLPLPDHRVQVHWVSEGFPWLASWDSRNRRDPCSTRVSGSTWALKYNIYYAAVQASSHERADKTYCGEKLWSRGFDKTKTHQRFVITSQPTDSKVVPYLTSDTEI